MNRQAKCTNVTIFPLALFADTFIRLQMVIKRVFGRKAI